MFDDDFLLMMTEFEREAWIAFKCVVTKLLGNNKETDCVTIVANMLDKFKDLGVINEINNSFIELAHGNFLTKILVQCVRSKENVSTKTLRKWKEDTTVGVMLT
jgi:hypothetical protein